MTTARATKALARLALAGALGLAVGAGLAAAWLDAEEIARIAGIELSERIGCPVTFAQVDVRWLPPLAVRLRDVRLQDTARERPFLSAERVELQLSLLALLRGRVALRALDVVAPTLVLDVDADGGVVLPPLAAGRSPSSPAELGLLGTRLSLRDGVAEIGLHRLEDIRIREAMRGAGRIELVFAAELPGTGALRDGRLTLSRGADRSLAWRADAVAEIDLAAFHALGFASSGGSAHGTVALSGADRSLASAELVMALQDLELRAAEEVAVRGDAALEARLGGAWTLELAAAELTLGGMLHKPAGIHARATGPVPHALPRAAPDDWEVRLDALEIGHSRLHGDVRMRAGWPSGELSGVVDLADAAAWSGSTGVVRGGTLHVERLAYAPPLPAHGRGRVEDARIELGERPWPLSLSGPVSWLGSELATTRAGVELAGERFEVAGSYDVVAEHLELEVAAPRGVELAQLADSVPLGPFETGRAYGRVALRGAPRLASLSGRGELEVFDGTASHLSLARVGPTGIAPGAGPHFFERLAGVFELREQRIDFTELILEQDGETARLSGSISLADGAVALAGDVEYVMEDEETVTPIQLSGTASRLSASVEDPPELQAERRSVELKMLEAMRMQIRERSSPDDDPERSRAVREHLQRIEERLRQVEESEPEESGADA